MHLRFVDQLWKWHEWTLILLPYITIFNPITSRLTLYITSLEFSDNVLYAPSANAASSLCYWRTVYSNTSHSQRQTQSSADRWHRKSTVITAAAVTCHTDRLQVGSPVYCRDVMLAVTLSLCFLVQLHSHAQTHTQLLIITITRLQCFDAVGWATGRASGL